jgi:glucose-1-phosphate thymidylyltransferase
MRGIVLAGGTGSRLWPITKVISKQLLPVYDKPMIYYPISTLMLAGVKDILIITTPQDQDNFKLLLGDGSQFGVKFEYAVQQKPEGLAQALLIAEDFLNGHSCLMILGDNIFHGGGLGESMQNEFPTEGAHIFIYEVSDPTQYGILSIDEFGNPISIVEKPTDSDSRLAVTGLYFFDQKASKIARGVVPSARGELEITSVLNEYLRNGNLTYTKLTRGSAWLDTGTINSLNDASQYLRVIEERTGLKVACLEEIGLRKGWLNRFDLETSAAAYGNKGDYGQYLLKLLNGAPSPETFVGINGCLTRISTISLNEKSDKVEISVIVPVYNPSFAEFETCLKSISSQTYLPIETIFVFDGMKDETATYLIMKYLPDARIIELEANLGQGSARNIAASKAKGNYLAFIDQDDVWEPTHLENFNKILSRRSFAFGYSDIDKIDKEGQVLSSSMMEETVRIGRNRLIKRDITDYLFRDLMIFPSSAIVNKNAFDAVNGFADNLRGHEDDELFRKLVTNFESHFYTGMKTSSWRSHPRGTSASVSMSYSRLEYGKRLFEEFKSDKIAKIGISQRIILSFLREISMTYKNSDEIFLRQSLDNLSSFLSICKEGNTPVSRKIRIFMGIPSFKLQKFALYCWVNIRK